MTKGNKYLVSDRLSMNLPSVVEKSKKIQAKDVFDLKKEPKKTNKKKKKKKIY